jgi:SAM-dependent methyltransferase
LWDQSVEQFSDVLATDNSDLSGFRDHGGKLILWHGYADPLIYADGTIEYYKRVQQQMGGPEKTVQFVRLFMAPGVGHCGGGNGPAPTGQFEAVVKWVEEGQAPETLQAVARNQRGEVVRTRPLCQYPLVAHYTAKFSTDDAASFECKPDSQYEPRVGQPGKDVVWVPSPEATVEKMLDVAKVTPQDFVVDLGSGDGRNVIAAARRGARALGVEYNPDMVELSKRNAQQAGVAQKATFVQGDMYAAEFSDATVLALFLLPDNLKKLRPKFADLKPGTRIVANTFGIEGWTAEEEVTLSQDCTSWCTVILYIVPANVDGAWKTPQGTLALKQSFQTVSGTLGSAPLENVKLRGDQLTFTAGGAAYSARVAGDAMKGTSKSGASETVWSAARIR